VDASGENDIAVTSKLQPYVTFKSVYRLEVIRISYCCHAGIAKEIKLKVLVHGFSIYITYDENSLHGL
jgi:hypothetical protein